MILIFDLDQKLSDLLQVWMTYEYGASICDVSSSPLLPFFLPFLSLSLLEMKNLASSVWHYTLDSIRKVVVIYWSSLMTLHAMNHVTCRQPMAIASQTCWLLASPPSLACPLPFASFIVGVSLIPSACDLGDLLNPASSLLIARTHSVLDKNA